MLDWLNFRHLYAFWMVAHASSFTRAAKQMHVAQSAVSAQVASLEEYFDEPLLVRTNRTVELTPTGRRLLAHADAIFAQSRTINALFRDKDARKLNPSLRVGVVGGASRNFVFRLLDRYVADVPGAHVSVSSGSYAELYDALKRMEVDAIVSLELPKKKDLATVAYEKLGESKMCVVGTPKVMRAIKNRKLKKPLEVFKFRHPFEFDLLGGHVKPRVRCEMTLRLDTDDIPLLRFFANSGRGVAVMPRVGILEDLESGTVEAMDLPRCPEVMIYGITTRQVDPMLGLDDAGALWRARRSD